MAKHFVTFALRLYNRYNHAHAQGLPMWQGPGPWADWDSKCSKTVEVECSCQGFKLCQREIVTE